jgi:hypothetical protein
MTLRYNIFNAYEQLLLSVTQTFFNSVNVKKISITILFNCE